MEDVEEHVGAHEGARIRQRNAGVRLGAEEVALFLAVTDEVHGRIEHSGRSGEGIIGQTKRGDGAGRMGMDVRES